MADRICENCMSRVPINAEKCPRCGVRFENTNPGGALPNGWVLGGRYTVGRYINIDGEGVTYSAIDGYTLQRVTVKEFMPVTLSATRDNHGLIIPKPGCEVLFKTTKMDFADLYGTLLRLGLVEGLVPVLDVLEENNTAYAILEKVEGPTLAEHLTKLDRPMETERALAMLRPVMIGIEALHGASLIHRGIAPENIVLESGGTAKLCGYATLALRQMGSELKPKLYPGYSAPEQYAASEFEGRYTDVYALGAVLYRMVTGLDPVPADERRMQDNLRPARQLDKDVPATLSTTLSRAMRLSPTERIQSIHDFRMALAGEGSKKSGGAPASKKSGRSGDGPFGLSRQQVIVAASALGAVVVLLVAVLLISVLNGGGDDASSSSASSSELVVPDFTGMIYEDVVKGLTYQDFVFDANPERVASEDVEVGRIISQTPAADSIWNGETPIKFVVSTGPENELMPDLVGMDIEEARATLNARGIRFSEEKLTNTGNYDEGEIIRTDPAANAQLTLGVNQTKVTLYVADKAPATSMPNLVGLSRGDAVAQLDALKIQYTITEVDNDGTAAAGIVYATSPQAGANVDPAKDKVTIQVYKKYYMPNLQSYVNQPVANLTNWLDARSANLSYSINYTDVTTESQNGIILSVDQPAVNTEVTSQSNVTITVGRYTAPPTPDPPSSSVPTPTPVPEPETT